MSLFSLTFHHLGLAVEDDRQAFIFFRHMGYAIGEKIYDSEQNVHLCLCTAPSLPAYEIITPGIGEGPLTPILRRHREWIYHTCFEVKDIGASLKSMEEAGLRVLALSPPKPAILFGGRSVSFYQVSGVGIIELLEP